MQQKHAAFQKALARWWGKHVCHIETLPDTQNVFELRHRFLASIAEALVPQGMLDLHQVRGAFAAYMNQLAADFKSVAASGWGPELIPEEDILQSQFPEVLEQIEQDQARIAELEALFTAVDAIEEGEEPEESEDGVLPKELFRSLKDERKQLTGKMKETQEDVKSIRQDIGRMEKASYAAAKINEKQSEARDSEAEAMDFLRQIETIDNLFGPPHSIGNGSQDAQGQYTSGGKQKDELIASARAKISDDEARQLIVERFQRLLIEQFDGYLRQYQRTFIAAVENLWNKYAVTTKQILAEHIEKQSNSIVF